MKHSFYPSEEIEAKLRAEAHRTHRTIRKTISDIVEAYYRAQEQACNVEQLTVEREDYRSEAATVLVSEGVTDMLLCNGLRYEDNRSKAGKVWVYDSANTEMVIHQVEQRFGVKFVYAEHGGKATNGKPAWYMK